MTQPLSCLELSFMTQSPLPDTTDNGFHIAIVMDGNGRSARQHRMPRLLGHRARRENVRRIVSACPDRGMRSLTRSAFATENRGRPQPEVDGRMRILGEFIDRETCNRHSGAYRPPSWSACRVTSSGSSATSRAIELTEANTRLTLAVALTYAGQANGVATVRALARPGSTQWQSTSKRSPTP